MPILRLHRLFDRFDARFGLQCFGMRKKMHDKIFSDFIVKKNISRNLNEEELNAIQSGEMSRLLECFYNIRLPLKQVQFECAMEGMEHSLQRVSLEDIVKSNTFEAKNLMFQRLSGAPEVFIGFSGDREALWALASDYAREEKLSWEDAKDAVWELLNCINGLFIAAIDKEESEEEGIRFHLPESCRACRISSAPGFYVLTFKVSGKEVKMILTLNGQTEMSRDAEGVNCGENTYCG